MTNFTQKDLDLFKQLVNLTEREMHYALKSTLSKYYKNIIVQPNYIVAIGEAPIALVAHMDTVFPFPAEAVFFDREEQILWSPEGLGADDRAGIFAALKLIFVNPRPSLIFTAGEEKGGIGASELAALSCPIPNLKYMIELDRSGSRDAVFYTTDTLEFIQYVEGFGFKEEKGTFSDISILADAWKICATNLSIGYYNEHSYSEYLNIREMYDTMHKVKQMIEAKNIPDFVYTPVDLYKVMQTACEKCGKDCQSFELLPVKTKNKSLKLYCADCWSKVAWCQACQAAFDSDDFCEDLCEDCRNVD